MTFDIDFSAFFLKFYVKNEAKSGFQSGWMHRDQIHSSGGGTPASCGLERFSLTARYARIKFVEWHLISILVRVRVRMGILLRSIL